MRTCTTRSGQELCFSQIYTHYFLQLMNISSHIMVLPLALEPPPGKAPCFAQLYVLDSHSIADTVTGMSFGDRLQGPIVEALADMLKCVNAYVQQFKQAATLEQSFFVSVFFLKWIPPTKGEDWKKEKKRKKKKGKKNRLPLMHLRSMWSSMQGPDLRREATTGHGRQRSQSSSPTRGAKTLLPTHETS
jgi:hypothetical protein